MKVVLVILAAAFAAGLVGALLIGHRRRTPSEKMDVHDEEVPPLPKTDMDYFRQLEEILMDTKIFLRPDCRREDFMSLIGVEKNRLGRIIRECSGYPSVSVYVNSLRLEHSVKLMAAHPEKKIREISVESGFETYQNYIRAFKEKYSDTPARYRRNVMNKTD